MLIRGKKTSSLRHFSYPSGKLDRRSAFSRRNETVLSRGTEERRREGEKVSKLVRNYREKQIIRSEKVCRTRLEIFN